MCKLLTARHKIFIFVRTYGKYDNKSNTIMNNNKYLVLRSVIFLKINQLHLIFPSWTNPRSERGVIKIYWACRHYNYTSYCAIIILQKNCSIVLKVFYIYFYIVFLFINSIQRFSKVFKIFLGQYCQAFATHHINLTWARLAISLDILPCSKRKSRLQFSLAGFVVLTVGWLPELFWKSSTSMNSFWSCYSKTGNNTI